MDKKGLVVGKNVILVVASQGYDHNAYKITKDILTQAGVIVITASDKPGGAISQDQETTAVDITLENINLENFDGIFFIGGLGAIKLPAYETPGAGLNSINSLNVPISYKLISQAKKLDKPYGAIGVSVQILVKSYGLQGKRATGYAHNEAYPALFTAFGAKYESGREIVTDGLVVTALNTSCAALFADGILRVLRKKALGA